MGTWDHGILDNDAAYDGLGDLKHGILEEVRALAAKKPAAETTGRLAGAVGLLLQLSPFDFTAESERREEIMGALAKHAQGFAALGPEAARVLGEIVAGRGAALAEREAVLPAAVASALSSGGRTGLGAREAALFASEPAVALVQETANRIVEMVEADFEDASNWSDLCREALAMGCLAALLVIEPRRVPTKTVERWRKLAQEGLAELEEREDDELEFHRVYYANLDTVFAALLKWV